MIISINKSVREIVAESITSFYSRFHTFIESVIFVQGQESEDTPGYWSKLIHSKLCEICSLQEIQVYQLNIYIVSILLH